MHGSSKHVMLQMSALAAKGPQSVRFFQLICQLHLSLAAGVLTAERAGLFRLALQLGL